jgi:CRISP-associated protein Cas1
MTELVLNTFGTSLAKEGENFLVVHPDGKQRIDPNKIKSILISKGASISSDAALLAIQKEVSVMFIDHMGKPAGRLWSVKFGSVSTIRRKQIDFSFSKTAIEWIKEICIQKINNQIALLLTIKPEQNPESRKTDKSITRLDDYKNKIKKLEGNIISEIAPTLRGWEGVSAKIYFETLNMFLPDAYKFESRSQHPATDVFNCLLNYGYGMLYGKIEGALIKAGIDPYVGIFHREDYNRPVLVFDVIEIFRVWVEYVVFHLLHQEVINEDCYSVKEDGSYWLEGLGKRILIQSLNDYLGEIIHMNNLERSRETHIELYAQQLAQKFLKN